MEKLPTHPDHSIGNNSSNITSNKWPDIENVLATKGREVENIGRDYILGSPFKSVLAVGAAGLLVGFLLSKFRA
jgi:ElaB/YqjD/DUF883 family membrane-anchored ribosome-binding protein